MAVGPYDFSTNFPDPGQAFLQSFQQAQQQRAVQQQQQAQLVQQQSRQQRYAQWVQRLRNDRSPETMSEFMLEFPEQSEAITKAFAPMDDAKKQTQLGFYSSALSALDRGDKDAAKQVVQARLAAAKNTIGAEQEAKELEYGLAMIDSNPDALRDALASTVFTLDPERYKTLYKVEKEEPFVTVPGVGIVLRRDIEAAIKAGEKGVSDANLKVRIPQAAIDDLRQNPGTASQFDAIFGAGSSKSILGGASSNASGGFRSEGNPR